MKRALCQISLPSASHNVSIKDTTAATPGHFKMELKTYGLNLTPWFRERVCHFSINSDLISTDPWRSSIMCGRLSRQEWKSLRSQGRRSPSVYGRWMNKEWGVYRVEPGPVLKRRIWYITQLNHETICYMKSARYKSICVCKVHRRYTD